MLLRPIFGKKKVEKTLFILPLLTFLFVLGGCNKSPLPSGSQANTTGNVNNIHSPQASGNGSTGANSLGSSGTDLGAGGDPNNQGISGQNDGDNDDDEEILAWIAANQGNSQSGLSFASYAGWPIGDLRRYDFCTNDRSHLGAFEIAEIEALAKDPSVKPTLERLKLGSNCKAKVMMYLTTLQKLNISGHRLQDIQILTQMKKLTDLNLAGNTLDLAMALPVLSKLPFLVTLSLRDNKLFDVSGLETLTTVVRLDLSTNRLTDVNALKVMRNLKFLDLSKNQIGQIATLNVLPKEVQINVSDNPGIATQFDTAQGGINPSQCTQPQNSPLGIVQCTVQDVVFIFNYAGDSTGWW